MDNIITVSRAEGWFLCHTCKIRHPCLNSHDYEDKMHAHKGHAVSYLNRDHLAQKGHHKLAAWNPKRLLLTAFGIKDVLMLRAALEGYTPNANVLQARQTIQTVTVTNLQSMASSPTAGWQGAEIDFSTPLYLDAIVQLVITHAATSPGSSKCGYVFAGGGLETGKLSNPMSGTQGSLTLTDITTTAVNPRLLGTMPYNTSAETVEGSPMSVASKFDGVMPIYWAPAYMNHTGAATSTSCTCKYTGLYATVI